MAFVQAADRNGTSIRPYTKLYSDTKFIGHISLYKKKDASKAMGS